MWIPQNILNYTLVANHICSYTPFGYGHDYERLAIKIIKDIRLWNHNDYERLAGTMINYRLRQFGAEQNSINNEKRNSNFV